MNVKKSQKAFETACKFIPGGVNSPVRSFYSVGGTPRYIVQGKGSRITDLDGNEYLDYVGSWGPLILGHADETVLAAVAKASRHGLTFGAPTENETLLAQIICRNFESVDMVRLVNSGTEAVLSALRLARAYTKRNKVVKAAGGYHGHVDQLLVQAGSGLATLGLPGSGGVAPATAEQTVVVEFNDPESVKQAFEQYGSDIAAVLIEPVAGNMGVIPPADGYLACLRTLCDKYGALLIFDEVITGFRVSPRGAQKLYGTPPDLTILGKIIGGGLPVGAYGGKKKIMQMLAPLGPVYQAGTLSGNPLATAAGVATLQRLDEPQVYAKLESLSAALEAGLKEAVKKAGVPLTINRVGSMLTPFFGHGPIRNYTDVQKTDKEAYNRFFHRMLDRGVYLPPSAFEAMFVSLAHTESDIEFTIGQARNSFEESKLPG